MVLQVFAHHHQPTSCGKKGSYCLTLLALDPDFLEPPDPDQFGQTARVIFIAFVNPR